MGRRDLAGRGDSMSDSPVIPNRGNERPDFATTKSAISGVAKQIRGRNRSVFFEQLRLGVWLLYAKARAREWQREPKTMSTRTKGSST